MESGNKTIFFNSKTLSFWSTSLMFSLNYIGLVQSKAEINSIQVGVPIQRKPFYFNC